MKKMTKTTRKFLAGILAAGLLLSTAEPCALYADAGTEESASVVINPVDYGADPTGAKDSTLAIWEAFEAAKKATEDGAEKVTVEFPKGEYHIYKDYAQKREYHTSNTNSIESPEKTIGLLIEGQENFTLDGNDSLFMMHGNMMALAVVDSENVTLQDFAWDFAVPTVSEMTITDMGTTDDGKAYTDFYIPKCFPYAISSNTIQWYSEQSPYTGEYYWTRTGIHENSYSIVAYHPDEEMTRAYYTSDSPFSGVSTIQSLGDTKVRIVYNSSRPSMQKVGMILQFTSSAYRETAGAFTWESENVTAKNVDVHFMHGFGWLVQMSTNVYYYDCDFMPRENSGHITVSYADGIHASGAAGDLVIENCNFANTHDDPINLHGTFTRVEQRVDDYTLVLKYIHRQQGGFPQYHVGDQVAFFTRNTLESTDNETLYTVEEVVSNPGEDGNDMRTMCIRFAEPLPENLSDQVSGEPKYVAENVTYAPEVQIRNCTFKDVTTRGILCTTRNKVVIEGNTFLNMSMASIYLSNDSDEWYESGPIRDMTIRNNTFYIKDIGRTSWAYACPIYIHPVTKGSGLPTEDNPIHKNITIEGNTFYMDTEEENPRSDDVDAVVRAESVENLTIRDNTILRADPGVEIQLTAEKTDLAAGETTSLSAVSSGNSHSKSADNLFEFVKCKNVVLEGNTYDDGLKRYAVISGMSSSNLTNGDSDITVKTSSDSVMFPAVGQISYESSDPEVASVDASGNVTANKGGTAAVYAYYEWNGTKICSNQIKITVDGAAGDANWQVPVENDTQLDTIAIPGLEFYEDNPQEESYYFNADSTQGTLQLEITGNDQIGEVQVLKGYGRSEAAYEKSGNIYMVPLELNTGLNSYYIQVYGKDGITKKQHIININYDAAGESSPEMITINGKQLEDFDAQTSQYRLTLDENSTSVTVGVEEGQAAEVRIAVNGVMTTEGAPISLKDGVNTICVVTVAADGISRNCYEIQAVKPYDSNADIYDIRINGKSVQDGLSEGMLKMLTEEESVQIEVVPMDERAVVEISNGLYSAYGKGNTTKTVKLYQNYSEVSIKVTSMDGTKTSERTIAFERGAYLSDKAYDSTSQVGYGSVMINKAPEGTAIRLTDEQGNIITYEKGIGAHADSEIIYDLSGASYKSLRGFAGVDYVKYNSEYANIKFVIQGDGVTLFESEAMRGNAPQQEVNISLEGVSRLVLQTSQEVNNWDAHAVWADMILGLEFQKEPTDAADVSELAQVLKEALLARFDGKTEAETEKLRSLIASAQELLDRLMQGDEVDASAAKETASQYVSSMKAELEELSKVPQTEPSTETDKPPVIQPSTELQKGDSVLYKGVKYQVVDAQAKTAAAVKGMNKNAKKLTIPAAVKIKGVACKVVQIQKSAFKNMKKLKTVNIGTNVKAIGKQSFYGCVKLKKLVFKGTAIRSIHKTAFKKSGTKVTLKVPKKMTKADKKKLQKMLKKAGVK